jgi:nucleoside-diphosphate-sugar epimerase
MRVLLTGSSGFIGKELQKLTSHVTYRCVTRRLSKDVVCDNFTITNLDSKTNWDGAFDNIDTIIHLGGLAHNKEYTLQEYNDINNMGTLHLAKMAASYGVKRFVFASSIGVNGSFTNQVPFSNTSEINPNNAYAQSKYDAEVGLRKIADETGLEVVIVRPTLVYGRNAPGNFGALTRLVQKLPFLPFGLASNKRDFIYVQNLASLLITCAKHPNAAGHTFLASDGETVSIKEFTNAIAGGLNKNLIQLPFPVSLMRLSARLMGKPAMAEQLLGNLQVDSSNAQEVLGWTPPYTMKQAMASLSEKKK